MVAFVAKGAGDATRFRLTKSALEKFISKTRKLLPAWQLHQRIKPLSDYCEVQLSVNYKGETKWPYRKEKLRRHAEINAEPTML